MSSAKILPAVVVSGVCHAVVGSSGTYSGRVAQEDRNRRKGIRNKKIILKRRGIMENSLIYWEKDYYWEGR
jgi:hypothetical protein